MLRTRLSDTARLAVSGTLAAALAVTAIPAHAQVADHDGVKEAKTVVEIWLEAQMAYEQIPSFQASVVHDQELVGSWVMGMAHPDRGEAATTETLYSICSISKLFTSIGVMQQRDLGRLTLRDEVGDLLPWFDLDQQFEGSPSITVEGILTHSAGLPRESDHPYWSGPDFPFPERQAIIDGLDNQETLYPARQYFQYSNLGLTLAGEIVQEVSGTEYHDYIRTNILNPLGMDDTFSDIPEEHRGGRLATGYSNMTRDGDRKEVAFFQAKGIAPAAGSASTAEDLARFASWQFRLRGDAEEILHAHTLDEMQRVHYVDPSWNTFWGLGFRTYERNDKTVVGHGGSCPGFRSQFMTVPAEKIATVYMANAMVNSGKFTNGIYDLMQGAIQAAAEDDGEDDVAQDGASSSGGTSIVDRLEAAGSRWTAQEKEKDGPDLTPYLGTYSGQPWGGERAVIQWKGGMATIGLPTDNPLRSITRFKHIEGDTFRRIRSDDELGEALIFERDAAGDVTGFRVHGNLSPKVR